MLFIINNGNWPTAKVRFFQIKKELETRTNIDYVDVFKYENKIFNIFIINIFYKFFLRLRIKKCLKQHNHIYLIKIFNLEILNFITKHKRPEQKVFFDVNDAFFLNFNGQKSTFSEKHLTHIDAFVFENFSLKYAMLKKFREINGIVIEDIPNINISVVNTNLSKGEKFKQSIDFIWVGSVSSVGPLFKIYELLESLAQVYLNLRLIVLGADSSHSPRFEKLRVKFIKSYNEDIMVQYLSNSHFGLFPTYDNQDSKLRGLHKIRNYMAFGVVPIVDEDFEILNSVNLAPFMLQYSLKDNCIKSLDDLITNGAPNNNWRALSIRGTEFISLNYNTKDYVNKLWGFVNNS